jgi:hypothetical protein
VQDGTERVFDEGCPAGALVSSAGLLPQGMMSVVHAGDNDELLKGIVDTHIHTNPDVRLRRLSDIALAQEAKRVGAKAIVIKSHVVPTMDRAAIAAEVVPGIQVFGGLVLNPPVGGFNKEAVAIALKMGAKEIWLPTSYSANDFRHQGKSGGLESVVDGSVVPELVEIFKILAKTDVILGTGHLSAYECRVVVEEAKKQGIKKIIVTHPEWTTVNMPIEDQKSLAQYGVFFERCYARSIEGKYHTNFKINLMAIDKVGYDTTIIATDGGQTENPMWSVALGEYLRFLLDAGVSKQMLDMMTKVYPAKLLGIV